MKFALVFCFAAAVSITTSFSNALERGLIGPPPLESKGGFVMLNAAKSTRWFLINNGMRESEDGNELHCN